MKLIIQNPYRVIGILSDASAREVQSRKGKISAYAKVGKEITSEYDFPFLTPLQRSSAVIDNAFSDIEQNQNKVTHSLFWFINLNPIDNTAIQHLISGNKEKAIEIWKKLTDEKEINSKNYSAFNNIGTLYLLDNSKEKIKQGITVKIKLIESENFKDFVHTVADETFSIDTNKQIELFVDEILLQLKNKFSTAETMGLFSNCNGTSQKYLSKKFTEEPIHKIETQLEQTKNKRKDNKGNAYRFGIDLHNNVKNELSLLKSILGAGNLQYKISADNVAKEVLQCSIDYFNESQEQEKTGNYLQEAMNLAKTAEALAVNVATKEKIRENIHTLEGMKDQELSKAIEVLKSIKNLYESNKAKINADILSTPLGYNQSINWNKVNQMIENSINWDKVVELVKDVIPSRNIDKIKISSEAIKITEYKSLVDFLLSKLNYSQKNQVKYICYWKTITTTAPVLGKPINTYKPTPTTSNSSNNNGCIYWIVGIIIFIILLRACN
ncbi:hypothetical protein ACM39_06100 [Chryseobacterium sp. FH2]|uniref:hypothetical protein n=1 Tax=Chryseobacterium sp. FH2 TaxID=1674291 RepID=UPI00065AC2CC|nr:hypothetical protein [Chryseobacterium sp. FH2]KMQ68855.1 hypothetical protein ACM39_06100 [Chryseobacterium sp. FH2]